MNIFKLHHLKQQVMGVCVYCVVRLHSIPVPVISSHVTCLPVVSQQPPPLPLHRPLSIHSSLYVTQEAMYTRGSGRDRVSQRGMRLFIDLMDKWWGNFVFAKIKPSLTTQPQPTPPLHAHTLILSFLHTHTQNNCKFHS